MIGIVVSRADEASTNIGEFLHERADWEVTEDETVDPGAGGGTVRRSGRFELRTFDGLHIELEGAAHPFSDLDALVFASRHSGESGPLLTAHFTGNPGRADFGGQPGRLARAWPAGLARILPALRDAAPEGYDVGIECTHHGPTDLEVPSMFVEVGSAEPQWQDPAAAEAVAKAILSLPARGGEDRTIVGFGGGHYAPRFERIIRETDWAVGHILAEWGLDDIEGDRRPVLEKVFERSGATRAVIDGDRPELATEIESLGYRVVSETWVRETDSVPLELVNDLEGRLCTVEEGLRFGDRVADIDDGVVYAPPSDLLEDLHGIDPAATRRAFEAQTVAFETIENGNRIQGRVALPEADAKDALIKAIIPVLDSKYDAVERADETVVVWERAFDPARARELGVPEGPAFGQLSRGEPVVVGEETISPEMVHTERERRYRL